MYPISPLFGIGNPASESPGLISRGRVLVTRAAAAGSAVGSLYYLYSEARYLSSEDYAKLTQEEKNRHFTEQILGSASPTVRLRLRDKFGLFDVTGRAVSGPPGTTSGQILVIDTRPKIN